MLNHSLLLTLCVLYGLFFAMGKIALQFVEPIFFTGVRMILAGIILLSYYYISCKPSKTLNKSQWWYIFVVGLFSIYLTNASEFWGLKFVSAGKTSLICCFYPIVTAIISWLFFKEIITRKKILGLLIGTLGFIPVLIGKEITENVSGTISFFSYAELALLFSAIATAFGWLCARNAIKYHNVHIVMLNGASMSIGGVMAMFHSYATETWAPLPIYNMKYFILWLLVITVISNIICYNLHGYLLKKFTATYISFANLSDPIFASFFGWFMLGEVLTYSFWLSVVCVGIGLSIYYKESIRLKE